MAMWAILLLTLPALHLQSIDTCTEACSKEYALCMISCMSDGDCVIGCVAKLAFCISQCPSEPVCAEKRHTLGNASDPVLFASNGKSFEMTNRATKRMEIRGTCSNGVLLGPGGAFLGFQFDTYLLLQGNGTMIPVQMCSPRFSNDDL